jgi:NAD(P)-dependent dehydrogenase (short-subunit alcohol dehydrogenase family)
MRIIVVGASGTVGPAVVDLLRSRGHEVVTVGRSSGDVRADISTAEGLTHLWEQVGDVDAVACAAGEVPFAPVTDLTSADYSSAWEKKALTQINLVRTGLDHVAPTGSFTLISGIVSRDPIRTGAAAAAVNGAIEAFVRAAAVEIAPRRINAVSPSVLTESLDAFDTFFPGFPPVDAADVARGYVKAIEGADTGRTIELP